MSPMTFITDPVEPFVKVDPLALCFGTTPYAKPPATVKPAISADMALLNNITANPNNSDCFTYEELSVVGVPFVVDVAITLTVKTPDKDPVTGLYQTETKALLNVSPRNVFNVWQLASQGIPNRVQPDQIITPSLLPGNVPTLIALP